MQEEKHFGGPIHYLPVIAAAAAVILLIFVLVIGALSVNSTSSTSTSTSLMSDSPNAVTSGFTAALDVADHTAQVVGHSFSGLSRSSKSAAAMTGHTAVKGGAAVGHATMKGLSVTARTIGSCFVWSFRTVGNGIAAVVFMPMKLVSYSAATPVVGTIIQPVDHESVPVIAEDSPALAAARTALPAAVSPATPATDVPMWPIHGVITTEFGEPEPPYQPIHTGIDISDGKPAGVTPVKAFRRGVVSAVITSGGLGNHVIVDHGGGVTSVYGHMSSIVVKVGQAVDTTTTLGFEGSTGVSTGPHVHFEIRINDQVTNPHQFITGNP